MDFDDSDEDWLEETPGAGPSRQGGFGDPLVHTEWDRLATRYSDAGYREGITDGKLSTLQQGFDQGFDLSVPASRRLGQLRGRANALLSHLLQQLDSGPGSRPGISHSRQHRPGPGPRTGSGPGNGNGNGNGQKAPTGPGAGAGSRTAVLEEHVGRLRELVRALGTVKRDRILPVDTEREEHERQDHDHGQDHEGPGHTAREDAAFELERNDQRDMEGLESAMEGISAARKTDTAPLTDVPGQELREEALLDDLQRRLEEIQQSAMSAIGLASGHAP